MTKIFPLQSDFSAGILSPRFHMRGDLESYRAGVQDMENFLALSHGPLQKRAGTRFVEALGKTNPQLYGFPVTSTQGFALSVAEVEAGGSTLTIHDPNGAYIDPSAQVLNNPALQTPTGTTWPAWASQTAWSRYRNANDRVEYQSDGSGVNLQMDQAGNTRFAGIRQLEAIDPSEEYRLEVDMGTFSTTMSSLEATRPHVYFRIEVFESNASGTEGGVRYDSGEIEFPEAQAQQSFSAVINSLAGDDYWYVRVYIRGKASNSNDYLTSVEGVRLYKTSDALPLQPIDTPWNGGDLRALQNAMPGGAPKMYFASRRHKLCLLSYDTSNGTWTFDNNPTIVGQPAEWTGDNWPGVICFYQGRMLLGSTPNEPTTFWGSGVGLANHLDFTLGDAQNPDAGFKFEIDERGEIRWMADAKNLLVGTETGEHIFTSEGGVLIPGDIQRTKQSSFGSRVHQPLQIGNEILYVSGDSRKIRRAVYQWTEEAFVSRDIMFQAEHLSAPNEYGDIVRLQWAPNPENQILALTNKGYILSGTYEREYGVMAWSRQYIGNGVTDIAVIEKASGSEIWVGAKRESFDENGDTLVSDTYLEVYDAAQYFDSWIRAEINPPSPTIDLPHLAGFTIEAYADGNYFGEFLVDSSGQIKLEGTVTLPGQQADAFWNNVVLALDMDGVEGGQDTNDKSAQNHPMSFEGTSKITLVNYDEGGTTARFEEDGGLTTPASDDWELGGPLGDEPFCLEFSVNLSELGSRNNPDAVSTIIGRADPNDNGNSAWSVAVYQDPETQWTWLYFQTIDATVAYRQLNVVQVDPTRWIKVAWEWDGQFSRVWVDGNLVSSFNGGGAGSGGATVESQTNSNGNDASNLNIPWPASNVEAGDVAILTAIHDSPAQVAWTNSPAGFTLIQNTGTPYSAVGCWIRECVGNEAGTIISDLVGQLDEGWVATVTIVRGVDYAAIASAITNPVGGGEEDLSTNTLRSPGVNGGAVVEDALVFTYMGGDAAPMSVTTWPAGFDESRNQNVHPLGSNCYVFEAFRRVANGSSVADGQWTISAVDRKGGGTLWLPALSIAADPAFPTNESNRPLSIANDGLSGQNAWFYGNVDQVRLTKGITRYGTNNYSVTNNIWPINVPLEESTFFGEYPASVVLAGIPFLSTMITLRMDAPTQRGPISAHPRRRNKIIVNYLSDEMPRINGVLPQWEPNVNAGPMDNTKYVKISETGYDLSAQVKIESDYPGLTRINGIFGEASSDAL